MRLALQDHLLTCNFWLMDVALVNTGSAPVLSPLYGFSSITSPELTLDVHEITEGNWFFKRKVLKRQADVGSITLQRDITFADSDFYSWIMNALAGENLLTSAANSTVGAIKDKIFGGKKVAFNPRRNLLLLHFFAHNPLAALFGAVGGAASAAFGGSFASGFAGAGTGLAGAQEALRNADSSGFLPELGPLDTIANFSKLIPARAFALSGCLPMRYKTGSDFDASSAQVSIQELEIAVESMEQIVLSL